MLDEERFYSKHRNSGSFREEQERKEQKRKHPVNANQSGLDLINVNDLVGEIKNRIGKARNRKVFLLTLKYQKLSCNFISLSLKRKMQLNLRRS